MEACALLRMLLAEKLPVSIPKSAGIKTPSLDGPMDVRNEGVSKLKCVSSSTDLYRRQLTKDSCSRAMFL